MTGVTTILAVAFTAVALHGADFKMLVQPSSSDLIWRLSIIAYFWCWQIGCVWDTNRQELVYIELPGKGSWQAHWKDCGGGTHLKMLRSAVYEIKVAPTYNSSRECTDLCLKLSVPILRAGTRRLAGQEQESHASAEATQTANLPDQPAAAVNVDTRGRFRRFGFDQGCACQMNDAVGIFASGRHFLSELPAPCVVRRRLASAQAEDFVSSGSEKPGELLTDETG